LRHFRAVISWYVEDRDVTIDKAVVAQVLIDFGDPRSEHWELMKRGTLPPEALLARRMEGLTVGVLGQLNATANWHRIACEWLFGDEPATPLGQDEAEFHGPPRRAAA
ncbi:MAG: AarF/ABC1/UbiB kinase family protein, partial [Actinomycetota bacterium]|nr:AarF/ABC1/UbiB kinase family protein [Actinomycetota bacterium]